MHNTQYTRLGCEELENRLMLTTGVFNLAEGAGQDEVTLRKSGEFITLFDDETGKVLTRFVASDFDTIRINGNTSEKESLTIDYAAAGFFNHDIRFDASSPDKLKVRGDGTLNASLSLFRTRIDIDETTIAPTSSSNIELVGFDTFTYDRSKSVGTATIFSQSTVDGTPGLRISDSRLRLKMFLNDIGKVVTEIPSSNQGSRNIIYKSFNANIENVEIQSVGFGKANALLELGDFRKLLPTISAGSGVNRLEITSNTDLTVSDLDSDGFATVEASKGTLKFEGFVDLLISDGDFGRSIDASASPIRTTVFGNGGNDIIRGGNSNDTLQGGDGDDQIFGLKGSDRILGGSGNDQLFGDQGNDTIDGGDGNDKIFGGFGSDSINGGLGNDRIRGGLGNDQIDGNLGQDSIIVMGTGSRDRMRIRTTASSDSMTYRRQGDQSKQNP